MKARIKQLEDIDSALLCCSACAQFFRTYGGTELELSDTFFWAICDCELCGCVMPALPYRYIGNPPVSPEYGFIALPCVDLDEK